MSDKTKRINITLLESEHIALKNLAKDKETSVSGVIRKMCLGKKK